MIKLVQTLGIAILAVSFAGTLTGCELYFGHEGEGSGDPTPPSGFGCKSNQDCAAGCYCNADKACEEAGFCSTNDDCAAGFHCDDRSSCAPNTCSDTVACPTGQVCESGTCTVTCECASDQEAKDQGFGYCDENTSTCQPGVDPAGSCSGAVTCNIVPTDCPQGEVPLIKDGCYTGACKAIAQCDTAPSCSALDNQPDCSARIDDCAIVSTGLNCKKPDGTLCQAGDVNCTCESFIFNSCEARTHSKPASSHWVRDSNGDYHSFDVQ